MRIWAFIALSLIALLGERPCFARDLPEFPGWRLDQTAPVEPVDPGTLEYKDFFTLSPPGARPPITVDGATAARLLNGQLNPETVYIERTAGTANQKKDDGASGGNGQVGWQVAESTYVPVGDEKSRNPAASITGSSSYAGMAGNGATAGVNPGAGGIAGMSAGLGAAASNGSLAVGGAVLSAGNSSGAGAGGFSGFNGGTAGKAAFNGGTGGASAATLDTSNMTYSQMIESANTEATKSACARMGSYAQGGFCSGK